MESFWLQVDEGELRQGDYLPGCSIPVVGPAFAVVGEPHEIRTDQGDLIIVTQSCDLEQRKVRLVAGCPIFPLAEFEAVNPAFARKGRWNEVLKGRIEGLHLLASPTAPEENRHPARFRARLRGHRSKSVADHLSEWGCERRGCLGPFRG